LVIDVTILSAFPLAATDTGHVLNKYVNTNCCGLVHTYDGPGTVHSEGEIRRKRKEEERKRKKVEETDHGFI